MIDPRVAKLRAKASDPAVTGPEAEALNAKADELEAKAVKATGQESAYREVTGHPWLSPDMRVWVRDVARRVPHSDMFDDLIAPMYQHDDEDPDYGYEDY